MPSFPQATSVSTCLSCSCDKLELVLDLGVHPLANNLLTLGDLEKDEPKFPLGLQVCQECWLMQLTHLVPAVDLFTDYFYFSSFSGTMLDHARRAVEVYQTDFELTEDSFVVEIASNDGYLLKNFVAAGIPCLGIEPAGNVAKVAREAGVETVERFFNSESASEICSGYQLADLILGNNVFAHVPDTNDFIAGVKTLLAPEGHIVFEFPYALDFLEKSEFDTIYHEHVFYFSLTALIPLFSRHGLSITNVERLSIHGGSLRLTARHEGVQVPSKVVASLVAEEREAGLTDPGRYHQFGEAVDEIKKTLTGLLADLKAGGQSIAAYGASAKGSTLLNFSGIGKDLIDFVVDRSNYKQGKFTPGSHLPILPAEALAEKQPDYALLLTWNFAEEILNQQSEFTAAGGKFVAPIPTPRILDGSKN
ncbi:MAG: methyltransferase domain-containing protein [Verrucomicrobiales bacterium]|nr:methyltransferase domain-containing protein [Verrucomicrobiales bacterium]